MKKKLLLLLWTFTLCMVSNAQQTEPKKINFYNINISAGPGSATLKNKDLDSEFKLKLMNYNLGVEYQRSLLSTSLDLSYAKASFKDFSTLKRDVFDGAFMVGIVIAGGFRLSFPVQIGVGYCNYSGNDEYAMDSESYIYFKFRPRVKFYITNKIGLFVGYTLSTGSGNDKTYKMRSNKSTFDGGLTFQLGHQ